ncbi:MAG: hypothetical protein HY275_18485, partial [Gemmatimonadetes bacterium]|nr:hypothetical protein [Gemmatimonadota bacterium]
VPPLDADLAAELLAAAWIIGWLILAIARVRARPLARAAALALLLVAGVAAATAVESARRARAAHLAVVQGGDPLRALPALGAEASGTVAGGEVARVLEAGDVWSRVALDLGRTGWIASERLRPLAAE